MAIPDLTDKITRRDDQYCAAGGFSDVFRCRYTSDDEVMEVAVKAFRFNFSVDENKHDKGKAPRMIRRELGIWRRLNHRNIVPFLGITHGFGKQGNAALVSMWMPHGTLHTFLGAHEDRLGVAHRLQLLLDIANGLHYLHSFPMVHGDLTCNNVLLDRNYNACLADFGCASLVGELPEGLTYLKMSTVRPGTLRWAAPEHFMLDESEKKHAIKSDIYSFGNIALLVLSGKYPWSEVHADVAVVLRLSQGLKPSRPLSRPIDDQHWALIELCWSSMSERPPAEDVMSSLKQHLGEYPPPSPIGDLLALPISSSSVPGNSDSKDRDLITPSNISNCRNDEVDDEIAQTRKRNWGLSESVPRNKIASSRKWTWWPFEATNKKRSRSPSPSVTLTCCEDDSSEALSTLSQPIGTNPSIHSAQLGASITQQFTSGASSFRCSRTSRPPGFEGYLESCSAKSEDCSSGLPSGRSIVRSRKNYPDGRGAIGDIWKCDLISGAHSRIVAVKVVDTDDHEDTNSREKKLRTNFEVLGRLRHKNVIPLLGVVSGFGPLPSMVSPWLHSGSLSVYLARRHARLDSAQRHGLLVNIAAGLRYLHSQGVIHGNLNSDNVSIDDDGTACLSDFGLPFIILKASHLKASSDVRFMDPALIQQRNTSCDVFNPTKPCDIYSVGGLMLHVLSGKHPFDASPPPIVFCKVAQGERPKIPSHERHIMPWHKSLMQMCWEPEEHKRPSADDLVRMLDRQLSCPW